MNKGRRRVEDRRGEVRKWMGVPLHSDILELVL
jgi:hypothetical protein